MQPPSTPAQHTQKRFPSLRSRRVKVLGSICVVIVLLLAAYWYASSQPIINPAIVSQANFPVYVPRSAPAGYRLDATKTRLESNIFTYMFHSAESGIEITVTVQPRPRGFDMAKLTSGGSINATSTKNGQLYHLSAGGLSQFLLDSGDGLIFITSPSNIGNTTVHTLADNLVRLN